MRRLLLINKVGKSENSYVVGSNIGSQSRFVRSALKRHSSNNSQGLCCDANDNNSKLSFRITYAVTNINLTDLSVAQRQTLTSLLKDEYADILHISRSMVVIDLTQDSGALVIYVTLKPETPNLKILTDYFIGNAGVKTSAETVIQTYLDTISVGTVVVTLQKTQYITYSATIPPSIYNVCTSVSSNVNVKASNGNKYVLNNGSFYDPYVRYNLNNGYYELNNIPVAHPIAILNASKTNLIKYIGDPGNKLTYTIAGTTDDAEYDFYHGNVRVYVYGDFNSVSLYCRWHGYMGGENLLRYHPTCSSVAIPSPTITIGSITAGVTDGSTTNDSSISLTFLTSVATTSLIISDITVTNGQITNFVPTSSTFYTATFTPTTNGASTINVLAGTFTDDVGNYNIASTEFNWTYYAVLPTMNINGGIVSDGETTGDPFLNLKFTASTITTDFVAGDITVTNGVLSEFDGSGTIYTAKFTPTAGAGVVATTINVAASVFTGAIGNSNTAATEFKWSYDNTTPNIAITSSAVDNGAANNDATIDLTFISTLGTIDFVESDITLTNGTLTGFTPVSATTYTATLTPTGQGSTGVTIAAGVFTGSTNSNPNTATIPFIYTYDTTLPDMTITSETVSNGATSTDSSIKLVFTSTKPTSTFIEADIILTNGSLTAFTSYNDTGTIYSAYFLPTSGYTGVTAINVPGGSYVDSAGNSNTVAPVFNWTHEGSTPYMTVTSSAVVNGGTSADTSIPLVFTSSLDTATGTFTLADIVVTGGSLTPPLVATGDPKIFTCSLTPTSVGTDSQVTVNIAAGKFIDSYGNQNSVSQEFAWNYDATNSVDYTVSFAHGGSNSNYLLTGSDRGGAYPIGSYNRTVNIILGDSLKFVANDAGHPLWLKNTRVAGTSDPVSTPVATNNGADVGSILWTPSLAGTYYYVCENHAAMSGLIVVSPVKSYTVNVSSAGTSAYILTGTDRVSSVNGNNPDVNIYVDETINFKVSAPGHPFYLKTVTGTGTANPVSGGSLTNNGTESLTVSWTPTVAGTYFYVCQHHGAMNGKLIVT